MDMRELSYGVEIETVGRTREAVARAIQTAVGGEVRYLGSPFSFDPWQVTDDQGRVWKVVKDASLNNVPEHLRAEIVSPILNYGDMETLQQVIRAVRGRARAWTPRRPSTSTSARTPSTGGRCPGCEAGVQAGADSSSPRSESGRNGSAATRSR
jgi:hypothetical protein